MRKWWIYLHRVSATCRMEIIFAPCRKNAWGRNSHIEWIWCYCKSCRLAIIHEQRCVKSCYSVRYCVCNFYLIWKRANCCAGTDDYFGCSTRLLQSEEDRCSDKLKWYLRLSIRRSPANCRQVIGDLIWEFFCFIIKSCLAKCKRVSRKYLDDRQFTFRFCSGYFVIQIGAYI
jgi:hypothetical protein